jgi:acyl carrier protein
MNNMEEKIIKLIAEVLQVPTSDVTTETEIGELDEWDSLRNVTIIAELQKQFNITITQDMLMDLENVADIIDLVEDLTK